MLFVIIVHLVPLGLTIFLLRGNKPLFIVFELFIIGSGIIAWQLYQQLIRPLQLLVQGTVAIREKDFSVKFLPTGRSEVDELVQIYNRMIDELRAERVKQEQQHFFLEKLIESSPTGILILDYDECIRLVNTKALQLLNVTDDELTGKSIRQFPHPVVSEVIKLKPGQARTLTIDGNKKIRIQKAIFIDRGFSRYFIMLEELTMEILAAEKKAYGKVIRMMAHEVNNTIGPVNSILQSTLESQPHARIIENALQTAIDRNNNLNIFMRNFADVVRMPDPVKRPEDMIQLLQNVTALMKMQIGDKKITFQHEFLCPSFIIDTDIQQMEQVLINIIKNAIEAIDTEGVITVTADCAARTLVVRDTGRGISPDDEGNIFSPFFSTKRGGQGIGLILIREILANHGFNYSLKTMADGETAFTISFP